MPIFLSGRLIALCCVAACLCCCSCFEGDEKVLIGDGTVQQVGGLSGDCWRITGKDGVNYEPLNLPDEFKVDGQDVRFTAKLEENTVTTCMVGKPVELLGIRKAS